MVNTGKSNYSCYFAPICLWENKQIILPKSTTISFSLEKNEVFSYQKETNPVELSMNVSLKKFLSLVPNWLSSYQLYKNFHLAPSHNKDYLSLIANRCLFTLLIFFIALFYFINFALRRENEGMVFITTVFIVPALLLVLFKAILSSPYFFLLTPLTTIALFCTYSVWLRKKANLL